MSGRALRVLAVTLRYPPYVAGGYELLTRDAVEALRDRGHEVTVLAGRGLRLDDTRGVLPWLEPGLDEGPDLFRRSWEGSNADRFRLHFLRLANHRATRRALHATGAEVLLAFNLGLVSLAPLLAARHAGVPTLTFASDPWPANHWLEDWERDVARAGKDERLRLLRTYWGSFRDLVGLGRVLTCSAYLSGRLAASGIDAGSLAVLHLGVPPDVERAAPAGLPARGPRDPLRVACFSSFWDGKGQDVLVRAAGLARAAGTDLCVLLAGGGEGEYRARLVRDVEELGLADVVRFEAGLDRAGVARRLAGSHVVVVPSVWGEPFPLVTLEAMACGLPAVVSDAGGSSEAIEDGVHGRVVPAGDAGALAAVLGELAADEPGRARLGTAARERARDELSHARFVDGLEAELFGVLGEGSGGRAR